MHMQQIIDGRMCYDKLHIYLYSVGWQPSFDKQISRNQKSGGVQRGRVMDPNGNKIQNCCSSRLGALTMH